MNGKKIYLINFNNDIYYIKLNKRDLEFYNHFFHKTIQKNIEVFDLKYTDNVIFILFVTTNSELGLIRINLLKTDEINIDWLESDNASSMTTDCISIEIVDNLIHFFYRRYDSQSTISYIYHGIMSNSCQLYELCKINFTKYVCSLYTTTFKNKIFLLVCEDYEKGIYSLRCLSEFNSIPIRFFELPNAFSLNLLSTNDSIMLFYNKIVDKNIAFIQKNILIIRDKFTLSDEIVIDIDKSIIKPIVSFYNNKFYIYWNLKDCIRLITTSDLLNWSKVYNFNKNNFILGTIFKATLPVGILHGFIIENEINLKINISAKNKTTPTLSNDNLIINKYLMHSLNSLSLKYIKMLHEKNKEIDNLRDLLQTTSTQYERRISKLSIASNSLRNYYESLILNLLTIIEEKSKLIDQLFRFRNKNNP